MKYKSNGRGVLIFNLWIALVLFESGNNQLIDSHVVTRRIRGEVGRINVAGVNLEYRGLRDDPRVPGEEAVLVETPTTIKNLHQIAEAIKYNEHLMLVGETGVGKSALVRYLAHLTGTPLYWVNLSEQTDPTELIGKYAPTDKKGVYKWVDGVLIRAMKEGAWVFLDDINLAPPEILERMNSLLDDEGYIRVTEHEGELVRPAPGFRLIVARNPAYYKGRQRLSEAFINKFTQINIDELPDKEKVEILKAKGMPEEVSKAMVELNRKMQELAKEGRLGRSRVDGYHFGLRDLNVFAEYINTYRDKFGLIEAFGRGAVYVYRDRLETEEAKAEFDRILSQISINGQGIDLEEIIGEEASRSFLIEPTIENLFREIMRGIPQDSIAGKVCTVILNLLGSEDKYMQITGLELLIKLSILGLDKLALEVLIKFAEDEDKNIRASVAKALVNTGRKDDEVIDTLIKLAGDEDSEVCKSAAEALGNLGRKDDKVIDALIKLAVDVHSWPWNRESAIEVLGKLGRSDDKVIDTLIKLAGDEYYRFRELAAKALGKLGRKDDKVIDTLIKLAGDEDGYVRTSAAEALGKLGRKDDKVIDTLIKLVEENKSASAAEALGNLGRKDDKVIDALIKLVVDVHSWPWNRESAAKALGELGRSDDKVIDKVIDTLIKLAGDEDSEVRESAAEALGNLGRSDDKVIDTLIKLAGDEVDWVRKSAVEALGKLGREDDKVIDTLIELTGDSNGYVRKAAAEALGKLGRSDDKVIDTLIQLTGDGDLRVRESVAEALGKLGRSDDKVVDALIALARDGWRNVRVSVAKALGNLGRSDDKVIDTLIALARDANEDVCKAAAEALGKLINMEDISNYREIINKNLSRLNRLLSRNLPQVDKPGADIKALLDIFGIEQGEGGKLVPSLEDAQLILTPTTIANICAILPAVKLNQPVMLVGPTGSGKTAIIRYLAAVTNNNYVRINLKDMTDITELIGGYVPQADGSLKWQDGLLVEAVKNGYWLVLDEANLAGSGILERINQLLDKGGYLVLQEHEGEVIKVNPNFRLFVSMNPTDYAGRKQLSPAFLNRFAIKWFDRIPDEELVEIMSQKHGISEEVVRPVVQFHHHISELAEHKEIGRLQPERYVYTIRDLQRLMVRIKDKIEGLSDIDEIMRVVVEEIRQVYGARLRDEVDRQIFEDQLKIHFKPEWL